MQRHWQKRNQKTWCQTRRDCNGVRETATARRDCDGERLRRRARVSTMAAGARDHVRRQGAVTSEWAERAGCRAYLAKEVLRPALAVLLVRDVGEGSRHGGGSRACGAGDSLVGRFGSLPASCLGANRDAVVKPVHGASLVWPSVSANTFFSCPAC